MDSTVPGNKRLLEILPRNTSVGKGKILSKRRMLLGSADACELRFDAPSIDPIHAVVEISGQGGKIYDMDSRSGVFVNGNKVISSEIKVGDFLQIGGFEFVVKLFDRSDVLPPPLQMLEGQVMENRPRVVPSGHIPPQASHGLPDRVPELVKEQFVPRVEYPLAKDPNAEFSEYIFEDVESLYPIFKYSPGLSSVEVIVLFEGQIYSVDYVSADDGNYRLVGYGSKNNEIEYASLGKKEKMDFISVQGGEVFVTPLTGYKAKSLEHDDLGSQSAILLLEDDIVSFERDLVKIFVRRTERPPKTKRAPIFRRDEGIKKYMFIVFFLVSLLLGFLSMFEVDRDLDKEKAPERIATILYNKKPRKIKKIVATKEIPPDKTKNAPKKVAQKSPNTKKIEKKKPDPKPPKKVAQKAGKKSPVKGKVRKAKPKKGPANKIKKVTNSPKPSPNKGTAKPSKGPKRKASPSKAVGNVDTYKSFDFSSTVSALMAKGGGAKGVRTASFSSSVGTSGVVGSSESARSQRASVSTNVGSLEGAASGKLDSASGAEGLSNKRGIYTAGIPSDTVVLGGMDPDIIRRILLDHVPQFRGCYQRALDRPGSSVFSGVGKFNFVIGSSGYVTRAGVDTASGVPGSVKQCIADVLKGIKFPEPVGGGIVEVNQPFNFTAKRRG